MKNEKRLIAEDNKLDKNMKRLDDINLNDYIDEYIDGHMDDIDELADDISMLQQYDRFDEEFENYDAWIQNKLEDVCRIIIQKIEKDLGNSLSYSEEKQAKGIIKDQLYGEAVNMT